LRFSGGAQNQLGRPRFNVDAKAAVKLLRDRQNRQVQSEMIDRMNT